MEVPGSNIIPLYHPAESTDVSCSEIGIFQKREKDLLSKDPTVLSDRHLFLKKLERKLLTTKHFITHKHPLVNMYRSL